MVMNIALCRVCESQINPIAHLAYQRKRGRDDRMWYYFNIASDTRSGGLVGQCIRTLQRHGWKVAGDTLKCPCY